MINHDQLIVSSQLNDGFFFVRKVQISILYRAFRRAYIRPPKDKTGSTLLKQNDLSCGRVPSVVFERRFAWNPWHSARPLFKDYHRGSSLSKVQYSRARPNSDEIARKSARTRARRALGNSFNAREQKCYSVLHTSTNITGMHNSPYYNFAIIICTIVTQFQVFFKTT